MPSIIALTERKKKIKSELDKKILICAPLLQTLSKLNTNLLEYALNEKCAVIVLTTKAVSFFPFNKCALPTVTYQVSLQLHHTNKRPAS